MISEETTARYELIMATRLLWSLLVFQGWGKGEFWQVCQLVQRKGPLRTETKVYYSRKPKRKGFAWDGFGIQTCQEEGLNKTTLEGKETADIKKHLGI